MVDTLIEFDSEGFTIKVTELDNHPEHPGKTRTFYPWNWHP